jgi:hypothetical protein
MVTHHGLFSAYLTNLGHFSSPDFQANNPNILSFADLLIKKNVRM